VPTERLLELVPWLAQVPRRPPPLKDRAIRREVARCLPFRTMNLHAARSARALVTLVLADLAKVTAPTLVLQGARDTVVAPRGAARLDAGLTHAPHRLVSFAGSDHLLALDAEREQVFDEVARFLT
jgi:carboxylesterase